MLSNKILLPKKRCSPQDFEKVFLSDLIVSTPPPMTFPTLQNESRRCVLNTVKGVKPLGFIYYGKNQGDYDYYHLATYPKQIKQHFGYFYWTGKANSPDKVVELYAELIPFVNRLHSQLDFHLAFIHNKGDPWFNLPHNSLSGILIYDWVLQQGNFGISSFVEHCYGLLPFDS